MQNKKSLLIATLSCALFSLPALQPLQAGTVEVVSEKLGGATREALGGFRDGFSKVGEQRDQVPMEPAESVGAAGLTVNSAKNAGFEEILFAKGLSCYLVADKPAKGSLVARALNEAGVELGSSRIYVHFAPNLGQKVVFEYPRSLDIKLVTKYVLEFYPSSISVELAPDLEEKTGLRLSQLEEPGTQHREVLTGYAVATRAFSGELMAKGFAASGEEISRVILPLHMRAEEADTLRFAFYGKTEQISRYLIEPAGAAALPIVLSPTLNDNGLAISQVTVESVGGASLVVTGYLVASRSFSGSLLTKAFDSEGRELDRSQVELRLNPEQSQELRFAFSDRAQKASRFTMEPLARAGVPIEASPSLQAAALEMPRAEDKGLFEGKSQVVLYLIAGESFNGKILVKALNAAGQEVGRSVEALTLDADDARELLFSFPPFMASQQVQRYKVEAKPANKPTAATTP